MDVVDTHTPVISPDVTRHPLGPAVSFHSNLAATGGSRD